MNLSENPKQNDVSTKTFDSSNSSDGSNGKNNGKKNQSHIAKTLPVFPLDVFPPIYQNAVSEIADSIGAPVDIVAMTLITLIGAAIGRTICLKIKRNWKEHPNLYVGIVGPSGIGKSPACRAIYKPVMPIERNWYEDFKLELGPDPKWPYPKQKQLIVDDATTESIAWALDANPRGILWSCDELAGLFKNLDKYTGQAGSTKPRLMSAYDSGPWKVNRVDPTKTVNIPHATLSMFGTIQERALIDIFTKKDIEIGFVFRFLWIVVDQDKPAMWTDKKISAETDNAIGKLVGDTLKYDFDDSNKPKVLELDPDGKEVYIEWHNKIAKDNWIDLDREEQDGYDRKLQAQCLRVILIIHCMDSIALGESECKPIGKDIVNKAIVICDCLKLHKDRVISLILESRKKNIHPIVKRIANAICELEHEITKGRIQTARVTEFVNKDLDENFRMTSAEVGKVAAKLELTTKHMPDGNSRAIEIQPDDIERLRNLLNMPSNPSKSSENI